MINVYLALLQFALRSGIDCAKWDAERTSFLYLLPTLVN